MANSKVAIPIIKNFLKHLNIEIVEKDGFEADDGKPLSKSTK
jgi:5'-3' exonuclease